MPIQLFSPPQVALIIRNGTGMNPFWKMKHRITRSRELWRLHTAYDVEDLELQAMCMVHRCQGVETFGLVDTMKNVGTRTLLDDDDAEVTFSPVAHGSPGHLDLVQRLSAHAADMLFVLEDLETAFAELHSPSSRPSTGQAQEIVLTREQSHIILMLHDELPQGVGVQLLDHCRATCCLQNSRFGLTSEEAACQSYRRCRNKDHDGDRCGAAVVPLKLQGAVDTSVRYVLVDHQAEFRW